MGFSEWGFLIRNKNDLDHIIELIEEHNNTEDLGEPLFATCVFKYKDTIYLIICNGGGRIRTSDFILKNYEGTQCYYPFEKPSWWNSTDEQQIIWNKDEKIVASQLAQENTVLTKDLYPPLSIFNTEPSKLNIKTLKSKSKIFDTYCYPTTCFKNQKCLFIYGDNDVSKGCGGQAIIRHCTNAMGIPTKKYPSYDKTSYYTDAEFKENKTNIDESIMNIIRASHKYKIIYFPHDGLGTGLADLPKRAPLTYKHLNDVIKKYFGIDYDNSDYDSDTKEKMKDETDN